MLTLLLLVAFFWQFYIGYHRGWILQLFYSLGGLLSLVIAGQTYRPLANLLTLWVPYSNPTPDSTSYFFKRISLFQHSHLFYAGIAFLLICLGVYLLVRFLGIFVHLFPLDYFATWQTKLASGLVNGLLTLCFFAICLMVLATIPLAGIQNHLAASPLASWLINDLPFLSAWLQDLWSATIPAG